MSAEKRLKQLGIDLGTVSAPVANYVNAVRTGNLLFLAGKGPRAVDGKRPQGKVGREYTAEQLQHGGEGVSVLQYMQTARFWFESTQNWQSEFLALLGMVVLSIFLRQRGSPESKPVDAPHSQTGSE